MSFNMSWFSWERAILIYYVADVLFMLQPRLKLKKLGLENCMQKILTAMKSKQEMQNDF